MAKAEAGKGANKDIYRQVGTVWKGTSKISWEKWFF